MSTQNYARPELLAETEWLADHMNDSNVRILDCETPDAYNRAHIPGAVNVGTNIYIKGTNSIHVMPPPQISEFMGILGIGDDTLVVAYDGRDSLLAARFWWVLNYYGHTNVKVLNGGWHKWISEHRPITNLLASAPKATFTPKVDPSLLITGEALKSAIGEKGTTIWDVRSLGEHTGDSTRGNKYSGHIPNCCHLEWTHLMDTERLGTFKPANEILQMLANIGVTPNEQVYTY